MLIIGLGDINIPSGKTTFKATLKTDHQNGVGKIHLANVGYLNPYWGFLSIHLWYERIVYKKLLFNSNLLKPSFF